MRIPIGSRNLRSGLLLTAALIVPTFLWPEFWARTLSTECFLPYSYCQVWPPSVIWWNTRSGQGIGVFYLLLAAILSILLRRAHREILFHWAISTLPQVASCILFATAEYRCLARSRVAAPSTAVSLNSVGGHSGAGDGAPVNAAVPLSDAPS